MKKSTFALLAIGFTAGVASSVWASGAQDPDRDYDRFDGTGVSGKNINVIEWEGNLEIHVYPKGSLKGLALKMHEPERGKTVMVIGYRFDIDPKKQHIRRNIVSIPLKNFKVFKDPKEPDFDKIVISQNTLAAPLVAFQTDPEPTQLYPDGHPILLAEQKKKEEEAKLKAASLKAAVEAAQQGKSPQTVAPAIATPGAPAGAKQAAGKAPDAAPAGSADVEAAPKAETDGEGKIQNFAF